MIAAKKRAQSLERERKGEKKEKKYRKKTIFTNYASRKYLPRLKERKEKKKKQIVEAGCRVRSDSVRVVEALVTATPEFFKGKKKAEIKAYFRRH